MRRRAAVAVLLLGRMLLGMAVASLLTEDLEVERAQARLMAEVDAVPVAPPDPAARRRSVPAATAVPVGDAMAVLRIPRLGEDWRWVVVEGTDPAQLAVGPGHYPGTALPGERGNVGIAGHRLGHGSPFLHFDDLRVGDEVVLEQGGLAWRYSLTTAPRRVTADATWVLDQGRERELTLTTCWPLWGSSERLYVRGELVEVTRGS